MTPVETLCHTRAMTLTRSNINLYVMAFDAYRAAGKSTETAVRLARRYVAIR